MYRLLQHTSDSVPHCLSGLGGCMFPLALDNRVGHEGAPCTISMGNHGSFCAEICYGQGALDLPYHIRAQVRGVVSVADNAVSRVPTSGMEVRSMSGGPLL